MISEGSRDTKDWSNDAEHVFKQKTVILNCNNIFTAFTVFLSNECTLVSKWRLPKTLKKSELFQTFDLQCK